VEDRPTPSRLELADQGRYEGTVARAGGIKDVFSKNLLIFGNAESRDVCIPAGDREMEQSGGEMGKRSTCIKEN
jgi:hypothetical protein